MPIYEYECSACGQQFEEWQKMSDPPVRTCPKCGETGDGKVQRLISATAFHLKGGGWYKDLYSSSKGGSGSGSGGSASSASESKSSSSTDSGSSGSKSESSSSASATTSPTKTTAAK